MAAVILPEHKAIVDVLAGYGVDVFELVDPSELAQSTSTYFFVPAITCRLVSEIFPQQVFLRSTPEYTEWRNLFWSQQQSESKPACILQPTSSRQVAIALLIARLWNCPFAVKSGGHAAFAGASSITDGLTIDLQRLNTIQLASDKKSVRVGPGNRWIDVYKSLEPQSLTAIGGRVSDIGVGGLTLGAQYGFACDNVNSFEVVIANGRILNVNQQSHPDLYWALRGGGNNFGIVTRFDLATYPVEELWAGSRIYIVDDSTRKPLLAAVVKFADEWPSDPRAALICNFAYAQGMFVAAVDMEYTKPAENPPIFDTFKAIPAMRDTMGIKSQSNVTLEFKASNPNGLRESYWTVTVKLDIEMITFVADSYMAGIDPIKNVTGIVPALTLQVISPSMIVKMSKNGGNALGLKPSEGPLLLVLVNVMWADRADDEAVLNAVSDIINAVKYEAESSKKLNKFIYMNYASQFQNVIESYGSASYERLLQVARRYDPSRVFQELQPGYFKLTPGR
ncbi:FAD binding domain-containing protein [Histoplasma capsulatum H143]|uniref:FAD binding domain-containing protein n=1 Tax=Ajellomyces capsulatus (strain H143) TaxID=544712 RepID=C6HCL4_AJECH|nr:FAD binding domain-containing protein [Histoplasma capsulatum H143]